MMIERKDWPLWLVAAPRAIPASRAAEPGRGRLACLVDGKAVGNVKNDGPELLEPTTRALYH